MKTILLLMVSIALFIPAYAGSTATITEEVMLGIASRVAEKGEFQLVRGEDIIVSRHINIYPPAGLKPIETHVCIITKTEDSVKIEVNGKTVADISKQDKPELFQKLTACLLLPACKVGECRWITTGRDGARKFEKDINRTRKTPISWLYGYN